MYVPKHFKVESTDTLQQFIRDYSYGMLIVADENDIDANRLPFYLSSEKSPEQTKSRLGVLQCHVARKNPVWQKLAAAPRVLVVFQGPDAYVSPSWYATKADTGRVVPTWNYLAIHAEGRAQVTEDPEWLRRHLQHLTDHNESTMPDPWSLDDAPSDYTLRLMQAIVGIEINIETLTGKLKASQNQPQGNRAGVKAALKNRESICPAGMSEFVV